MQSFSDRFTLKYPALESVSFDTLTDLQLETVAPDVKVFADMVRGYSAIIRRKSTKEIYLICTRQVDPRISLILAAARDNAGIRIFPDLTTVKKLMFGPNDVDSTYEDSDLNIFVEGIKRCAAALTASIVIGQLAQIDEQAQHSKILESQAINDLDRIIKIPDLKTALEAVEAKEKDDVDTYAFYFEKKQMNLISSVLKAEIFMPSSLTTGWVEVGQYTGKFQVSSIVADIADAINGVTLINETSNIIAAPVLSGGSSSTTALHKIDFLARERDVNISAEIISVRFSYVGTSTDPIPFKWGLTSLTIAPEKINSLILAVQQGKAGAISNSTSTAKAGNAKPVALYFRRRSIDANDNVIDYDGNSIAKSVWSNTAKLKFRISPNQAQAVEVVIPYIVNAAAQDTQDSDRPAQVAEALLNGMYAVKGSTRALGALFRNDDPTSATSYSALELIAFSVTNPETWLILDVLEIPKDIEMAVGDLNTPLTPFSNKPRSIRVESTYKSSSEAIVIDSSGSSTAGKASPSSIKLGSSGYIKEALQKGKLLRDYLYD